MAELLQPVRTRYTYALVDYLHETFKQHPGYENVLAPLRSDGADVIHVNPDLDQPHGGSAGIIERQRGMRWRIRIAAIETSVSAEVDTATGMTTLCQMVAMAMTMDYYFAYKHIPLETREQHLQDWEQANPWYVPAVRVEVEDAQLGVTDSVEEFLDEDGDPAVVLWNGNTPGVRKVKELTWETFGRTVPDGMTIAHLDGDVTNNALENLYLVEDEQP